MQDIKYSANGSTLLINFTDKFKEVWSDKGSNGKFDGCFYRVDTDQLPVGFYSVGDLSKQGHQDPTGIHTIAIVKAGSADALRPPTGYKQIWTDKGSNADQDVSVWEPQAPAGYVAMGYVSQQGHDEPNVDRIRCVKSDLVVAAGVDEFIWDNKGSKSDDDFSTWSIATDSADEGWIFFSAKTFIGHESDSKPSSNDCTYVFRVAIQEVGPSGELTPPQLLSDSPPPQPTETVTSTSYLPWFAAQDPTMTEAEKVNQSICYKQVRVDQWVFCGDSTYNGSSNPMPWQVKRSSGKVDVEYNEYTQSTGIKIDVAFVIPDPEDPTKVNAQFGYGFSQTSISADAWASESSQQFTETIPPDTNMAFYQVQSTYRLYRYPYSDENATTEISGEVTYYAPGEITVAQYPAPS